MKTPAPLYLLPRPGAAVPGRWAEAFADGRGVAAAELAQGLGGASAGEDRPLLWLSTGMLDWPAQVRAHATAARVIVLSGAPDKEEGLQAMEAGARGYAHAYAVPALLREVAVVVSHGGLWLGPEVLQHLVSSTHDALRLRPRPASAAGGESGGGAIAAAWARLTAREVEVARAVAQGRSNKEVADALFISERTVKAHLGSIFDKLGVRDRLQLVLHMAAAAETPPPEPSA